VYTFIFYAPTFLAEYSLVSVRSLAEDPAIAYTYNERGWLLTSSAPLFELQLQYNTNAYGYSVGMQYNGNISSQSFGTSGAPNTSYFCYAYDKLNRLTTGDSNTGNNESGITYDLQGNNTALTRLAAASAIDNLTYSYTVSGNPHQPDAKRG